MKKRILFIGEGVTMAHVARPARLCSALDPSEFDLSFACDPSCKWMLGDFSGSYFLLASVGRERFLAAIAAGKPIFTESTLVRYVQDDLALLRASRPDAVVGDLRLSLSISARLAGVPYFAISNGYWSPHIEPLKVPVPDLALTRWLPLPAADFIFQLGKPFLEPLHCRPLNEARRRFGLASLGNNLREVYTDADCVLYADVPEIFSNPEMPQDHRFIGPLGWSPPVARPDWWATLPNDKPIVYVTLGSSGQASLLTEVLHALGSLEITVIAATAGYPVPDAIPANCKIAAYLPGEEAARRSRLVICNGGSPTSYQALAAGVPVIGLPSNLDQFLNMGALVSAGLGQIVRSDRFNRAALAQAVTQTLASSEPYAAATAIARVIANADVDSHFNAILREVLNRRSASPLGERLRIQPSASK